MLNKDMMNLEFPQRKPRKKTLGEMEASPWKEKRGGNPRSDRNSMKKLSVVLGYNMGESLLLSACSLEPGKKKTQSERPR